MDITTLIQQDDSQPKDIKGSIRQKYKRRLVWLYHAIEQYEIVANDRIEKGGNIRDRDEIEVILELIKPLKERLPKTDTEIDEKFNKRMCELFNMEYTPLI